MAKGHDWKRPSPSDVWQRMDLPTRLGSLPHRIMDPASGFIHPSRKRRCRREKKGGEQASHRSGRRPPARPSVIWRDRESNDDGERANDAEREAPSVIVVPVRIDHDRQATQVT